MRSLPTGRWKAPTPPASIQLDRGEIPTASASREAADEPGQSMTTAFRHEPVMAVEVVELFRPVPRGVVVDATVGGGGHARALLEAHPQIELVGLDRDAEAVTAAAAALAGFGDRVRLHHARFDQLQQTLQEMSDEHDEHETPAGVVGVLFDLGVSSPQLDRGERGFSYRIDAPLDMRMDRSEPTTAADVVNGTAEAELARILQVNGGERFARRVAHGIVERRPLATTGELVDVIKAAIPAPARRRGGHPAKRTFQAIRMEVNRELEQLDAGLGQAITLLAPQGRCVVLAYHSGEDRLVKRRFQDAATGGCVCPPGLPCTCGARPVVRLLRRGARKASAEELARNPRADSARLRAVEKLDDPGDDAA